MNNTNVGEAVNALMRGIEEEVARRRAQPATPRSVNTSRLADSTADSELAPFSWAEFAITPPDPVHLKLPAYAGSSGKAPFRPKTDGSYQLGDFLPYNDADFIDAAYQAVLKREADEDGMQTYLGMLRDGASKAEILGRLRGSREGRKLRVQVDGLSLSYALDAISRWPIIGKFVGIINAVWNLPNAQREQRRISNDFAFRLTQIDQRIADIATTVSNALEILEQSQNKLSDMTKSFAARSGLEAVQCSITRTAAALKSKPDRSELENLASGFRADLDEMEQSKANSHDFAVFRSKLEGLAENLSAMDIGKANREDLHSMREQSNANLKARVDQVTDLIRGTERASRDSMAAIELAHLQWKDRVARIEAEVDRAMDLVNEIVQATTDLGSIDVLKRELAGAIEQVRVQMLRALDSKAERQETTALSNHFVGLLQHHLKKEEFKGTLGDVNCRIDGLQRDSAASIEQATAQWNERIAQIAAVKVDQSALRAAQEESNAGLKAGLDRVLELVKAKADLGNVDVLKREMAAAIEQVRVQVLQTLESKAEREETTALSNHLIGLLQQQPAKEELARIAAALAKIDDVMTDVRQTKADSDDLALLRNAIGKETRDAFEDINALIRSKADQSTILDLHQRINRALSEMTQNAESVRREFVDEMEKVIESFRREKADQASTDAMRVETKAAIEMMNRRMEDSLAPVISRAQDLKRNVLDQERRVGLLLEEARKRLPAPIARKQLRAMLAEEEHRLDAMYASFEDKFRGTRSDIMQRLAIYLPRISDAKAGTSAAPVVDLGCGRGEWLELLHSNGFSALGVDLNRIFIASCRELDLKVTEQDALSFLQQRKANSVGAVTSFHLIEHLPHTKLISLIDETLRVLRPGGIAIFETPNPRNLIVAGCNFHLDPTHRRPLPPDLSRYLLEARGFCDVDILELHPFGSEFQIKEGAKEVKDTLNQYLFSAQDYAVIGRKAK